MPSLLWPDDLAEKFMALSGMYLERRVLRLTAIAIASFIAAGIFLVLGWFHAG